MTSGGGERDQGTESASRIVAPAISGDGNFVAFATTATNMVGGDTNKFQDVFVVGVDSGEIKRVSIGKDGLQGNADSPRGQGEKLAISFDGGWVAFTTAAANLGGALIMKNTQTGEIRVIVAEQGFGVGRPAISRNGGYVVFGAGSRLDARYQSSGIFARFTATTRCRFCIQ